MGRLNATQSSDKVFLVSARDFGSNAGGELALGSGPRFADSAMLTKHFSVVRHSSAVRRSSVVLQESQQHSVCFR